MQIINMKKVLVIDTNQGFTSDLERNLIINELENIEILTKNSIDEALNDLDALSPDEIVIPVTLISVGNWDVDIPVITYAHSNEEILYAHNQGFKSYGIIKKAIDLLDVIDKGGPLDIARTSIEVQESKEQAENKGILTTDGIPQQMQQQMIQPQKKKKNKNNQQNIPQQNNNPINLPTDSMQSERQPQNSTYQQTALNGQDYNGAHFKNEPSVHVDNTSLQIDPNMKIPPYMYDNQSYRTQKNLRQYQEYPLQGQENMEQYHDYSFQGQERTMFSYADQVVASQGYPANMNGQYLDVAMNMRQQVNQREILNNQIQHSANMNIANQQFNADMGYIKTPAKCVTVFAAKGGVGKTTISCELATFLALTSHGRGKFKVCIADFNIDFGDVLNTLAFDVNGANMTTWAADIRERIAGGEAPESIQYTEARMMTWLQKNDKDGLYALLAPISNADSMDIDDKCIDVMLNNLIYNCGFDYVICDTGNNTRDASFIALEKADEVFLILNQSVNTANCNNSFLATAQRVGFNLNKIKLIINKVIPAKVAGISTEELESAFRNPYTGRPYECIAKIKNNNDIINSGNLGNPLTYNSSHEFTHSIGGIVQYLTGGQTVLQKTEKKKGFFSFLSRKKS